MYCEQDGEVLRDRDRPGAGLKRIPLAAAEEGQSGCMSGDEGEAMAIVQARGDGGWTWVFTPVSASVVT